MPISKNGKPYYTDEQFEQARYNSSALEYAKAQGYDLVKKGKFYTMREHDSMVFTGRGMWFWNSRDVKGGAIEFMTIYEHKSFVEAVLTLAGENIQTQEAAPVYVRKEPVSIEKEKMEFQLPERNDKHQRVFAYLTQTRGIDGEIVSTLMKRGKLYETREHHNAAFVFENPDGQAVGAFLRGTLTQEGGQSFRGMAANSDRENGCFFFGAQSSKVACVFEAAIDAMSYATLQKLSGNTDWAGRYYAASGGTGDSNIIKFLQSHPQVNTVILCQDNDKAGEIQAEELAKKLREMDITVSRAVPKGKDFNDDLVALRRADQQRGGRHALTDSEQTAENMPTQPEENSDFIIME